MKITTRSEEETRQLGRRIGELAGGGFVLALFGDLGAGKTVFVQGLARGLGVDERTPITSPTYTLINAYPAAVFLYHVDLYRISDSAELAEIGFDEILTEGGVVAVEWAERCKEELPEDRLDIRIREAGEDLRTLEISAGGQLSRDLLQALQKRSGFRPDGQPSHMERHMALIVQKFGGTSVADAERIRNVARRAARYYDEGNDLVIILSAMAGVTDQLIALAKSAAPDPDRRELDVLLATGEQTTVALLAMMLKSMGYPALSLLGYQAEVLTDCAFGNARILEVGAARIGEYLKKRNIVVVAGFQGFDPRGNITTLGRGGSDTSAVAIAAALNADICEIYTDVDGIYTADPNICPKARKLKAVCYDEMLNMASLGAKVLQIRSVGFAKKFSVPIHVRSSFSEEEGTMVISEEPGMETVVVSAVTHDKDQARITLKKVPDQPGTAAKIFAPISEAGIVVDMIIQNTRATGQTDLTFTVPRSDFKRAMAIEEKVAEQIGAEEVFGDETIAKVSVIGVGMRNHSGVASLMFSTLAKEGINIAMISTSEIRISCIVEEKYTELAVRVLHTAFGLDREA